MRISSPWMQQLGVNAMLNQQSLVSQTQMQLSTGLRMASPADDPGAAVSAETLAESLKTNQQYQSNLTTAQSRLEFEDGALDTADTLLQQAKELAVRSLNGALTSNDRAALGQQAQQFLDQLVGVANTRNASGEYIFGGFRTDTPPFVFEPQPRNVVTGTQDVSGGFDYSLRLDASKPSVTHKIAFALNGGNPVTIGIPPGDYQSSQDLADAYNTAIAQDNTLNGNVTAQVGSDGSVKFVSNSPLTYKTAPINFDLTLDNGSTAQVSLPARKYDSAEELAAAITKAIDAEPNLKDRVIARARDGFIEFVGASEDTNPTIKLSDNADGFMTDLGFATPSSVVTGKQDLTQGIDYSAAAKTFTLTLGTVPPTSADVTIPAGNYASAGALATAINQGIDATPLQGRVMARTSGGGFIQFTSANNDANTSLALGNDGDGVLSDLGLITERSETQKPPSYVYQGDGNARALQIGSLRTISDGDPGSEVFQNIASNSNIAAIGSLNGKQNILNTLYSLTQALQGDMTGFSSAAMGNRDLSEGVDYSGNARSFRLTVDAESDVIDIPAKNYATPDELATEINNQIANIPGLQGKVEAAVAKAGDGYNYSAPVGTLVFRQPQQGNNPNANLTAAISVSGDGNGFLTEMGIGDPQSGLGLVQGSQVLPTAGIDYYANARTFEIAMNGGSPVKIGIAGKDYASADELAAAINSSLASTALNGKVRAQARDGLIAFTPTDSTTPDASIALSGNTNGFLTDLGVKDPQTSETLDFSSAVKATLSDLDSGLQRILDTRASVGARLNALDEQDSMQAKFILDTQSNLSELQDLDYAEAISRFSQQQTVLQASQQAFVKVQKLSLFDYL